MIFFYLACVLFDELEEKHEEKWNKTRDFRGFFNYVSHWFIFPRYLIWFMVRNVCFGEELLNNVRKINYIFSLLSENVIFYRFIYLFIYFFGYNFFKKIWHFPFLFLSMAPAFEAKWVWCIRILNLVPLILVSKVWFSWNVLFNILLVFLVLVSEIWTSLDDFFHYAICLWAKFKMLFRE